ncbi:TPA: hypothetical protein ACGXMC_005957 [Bacillus cereus]
MLRTVEATQKLFDEWAKTYDENLQEATGPLYGYNNSLIEVKEMIQLYKRGKIIDIGTGTFASLMRENNESVVGVDVSERMLETCK